MHRKLTLRLDEAEITPRVSPKVAAQLLGLADRDASKAYFARRLHEAGPPGWREELLFAALAEEPLNLGFAARPLRGGTRLQLPSQPFGSSERKG